MMFSNNPFPVWNLPRGNYISAELNKHSLNRNVYVPIQVAYAICTGGKIPYSTFQCDVVCQQSYGKVVYEEGRLHKANEWRYKAYAATQLAGILSSNTIPHHRFLKKIWSYRKRNDSGTGQ